MASTNLLEGHRIASIQARTIQYRYPRLVGLNARRGIHGTGPVLKIGVISTDRGATGWGLVRAAEMEALDLIGKPLADLFDPGQGVIAPEAMPLDFSLHDLAGRIAGESVHRLLGDRGPTAMPCYDGAIYMDDLLPEDAPRGVSVVLENCAHDYDLGYRAFKLKIGRGNQWMPPEEGLQRDIDVTRLVRDRYPECGLLVDANDGYSCQGFLRYLDAVADCGLYWVEEPFLENREDLLRLREFIDRRCPMTRIADGERDPDVPALLELAREGLIDVLLMDIQGYGFTPWRRVMPLIQEIGVATAPHAWGSGIKSLYAAQLGAGLGNVLTIEGVPGACADADWSAYSLSEGLLHVPAKPGFGIDLRAGA